MATTGCTGSGAGPSRDISYSAGDATWGPPGRVVTMGVAIANRGHDDVRIDSFEVIDAQGLTAEPLLVVGVPRESGSLAAAPGFPPPAETNWPVSSVHQLRFPIEIPAGTEIAAWGPEVLIRIERTGSSQYGYVKGLRVRGMEGKRRFEDVVHASLALCWAAGAATCRSV